MYIEEIEKSEMSPKKRILEGDRDLIRVLFICHGRALGTVISGDEVR